MDTPLKFELLHPLWHLIRARKAIHLTGYRYDLLERKTIRPN
jgi:hypothetical protein